MTIRSALLALSLALSLTGTAWSQVIGTVAATAGAAEVGRAGAWTPVEVGTAVQLGDELRTGDGRMRVVFQDDSVLNVSENTQIKIDEQVYQPAQGTFRSLIRLIGGKVRATIGSVYQRPGAQYEIETPTAVAGVRGTTFVVAYDTDAQNTEVIGIRGRVEVRGLDERIGDSVYVGAQETTTIGSGQRPTQPQRLDEQLYHQRLENLEIISLSGLGSLAAGAAVQTGNAVAPPESAPLTEGTLSSGMGELRDASDVVGQPLPVVETTRGRLGVPF